MKKYAFIPMLALVAAIASTISASAQVVAGVKYQIMNSLNLALAYRDSHLVIADPNEEDEMQQWIFIAQEDGNYALYNQGQQQYACLGTANGWDAVFVAELPEEITRGEFNIDEIEGMEYVGIRLIHNGKYMGTDKQTDGSWVYLDKKVTKNGYWTLIPLESGPEEAFYKQEQAIADYIIKNFEQFPEIQDSISERLLELEELYGLGDAGYDEGIGVLYTLMNTLKQAYDNIAASQEFLQVIDAELAGTDYPGRVELEQYVASVRAMFDSEDMTLDYLLAAPRLLQEALIRYRESQIPVATPENPADLTAYILHPSFREEFLYTSTSIPTSDGWIYECVAAQESDKGARHKYAGETGKDLTCYNSWNTSFESMKLSQTVTGLPDGKYRVQCMAWTSAGYASTQHAFATATSGLTSESPVATEAMESPEWEIFTTGDVLVYDGQLTIGFASTSDYSGPTGWFLVTDFRLLYTGMYTMDELREITKSLLADADTYTTPLSGDLQQLKEAIVVAQNATDVESLKAAIFALGNAKERVRTSNQVYDSFMANDFNPLVSNTSYGDDDDVARVVSTLTKDINTLLGSDEVLYEDVNGVSTYIKSFRKYADYYMTTTRPVLATPELYNPEAIRDLTVWAHNWWGDIEQDTNPATTDSLYWALRDLTQRVMLTHVPGDDADMTFVIQNADLEEGNDWWNNYWTVDKNDTWNGTQSEVGEHFLKDPSNRYLSATGGSGYLVMTAYNNVSGLMNGTYTLRAACRADALGAYLYAKNADGVVFKQQITPNGTLGGSIYAEAFKLAVQEAMERTGKSEQQVIMDEDYDCPVADSGWNWVELNGVEVLDHVLTIGISTDPAVTGGEEYQGYLLSGDDFRLTYTAAGDNRDMEYVSSIDTPEVQHEESDTLFDLQGRRVDVGTALPQGIYISGGRKIIVK